MLTLPTFLAAVFAAQAVLGNPVRSRTPYSVKEKHVVPLKWSEVDRAPKDHMLHLQIGLKQDKFDELDRHLHEGMFPDLYSGLC